MSATVVRYTGNGSIVRWSPGIVLPPATLAATISGTTLCDGCYPGAGTGHYYKATGSLNMTLPLVLNNTAIPGAPYAWVSADNPVTATQYSNSDCSTPTAATLIVRAELYMLCASSTWVFQVRDRIAGLGLYYAARRACDVVGGVILFSSAATCGAGAPSPVTALYTGGSVSVPLCP
jgi:hypothetical protein